MKFLLFLITITGISWAQLILTVNSRPQGAVVSVNGTVIGKTPVTNSSIPIGQHNILLVKDGYATIDYAIDVTPAKSLALDFQLNKLHLVTFKTNEKDLTFKLNDDYSWSDQKEKFLMEAGDHYLEVLRDGALIETREFTIDQPTEINFEFD